MKISVTSRTKRKAFVFSLRHRSSIVLFPSRGPVLCVSHVQRQHNSSRDSEASHERNLEDFIERKPLPEDTPRPRSVARRRPRRIAPPTGARRRRRGAQGSSSGEGELLDCLLKYVCELRAGRDTERAGRWLPFRRRLADMRRGNDGAIDDDLDNLRSPKITKITRPCSEPRLQELHLRRPRERKRSRAFLVSFGSSKEQVWRRASLLLSALGTHFSFRQNTNNSRARFALN